MKMNKLALGVALGLVMGSGTVMAQGNWYGGVAGGVASAPDQTGTIANNLVNNLGGSVAVTQNASVGVVRIFGGYQFTPVFALELGYLGSSDVNINIAGSTAGGVAYTGNGTESVSGLDLSAIIRPIATGRGNGLFLRAGLSDYTESASLTLNFSNGASGSSSASQTGLGQNFGIGYDWRHIGSGALRLELLFAQNVADDSGTNSSSLQVGYYW